MHYASTAMSGNRFTMTKKKQSFDEPWLATVTIWNSVHTKAIVSSSSETAPQMKKDRRNTGANIFMLIILVQKASAGSEHSEDCLTYFIVITSTMTSFNYFYCALIVYCRCILKVDISWQLDAGVFISSWTSYASTSSLYFGQPKRNLTIENVCLKLHK